MMRGAFAGISSSGRDIYLHGGSVCSPIFVSSCMLPPTRGRTAEEVNPYVQNIHKESRGCDARLHSYCHHSMARDYATLLSAKLFGTMEGNTTMGIVACKGSTVNEQS